MSLRNGTKSSNEGTFNYPKLWRCNLEVWRLNARNSRSSNNNNNKNGDATFATGIRSAFIVGDNNGEAMQMPAAHKAPLSLFHPFSLFPVRRSASVEVFEFFLFTPEAAFVLPPLPLFHPRASLFSAVLPFIGTPECLHCETGRVAGWFRHVCRFHEFHL